MLVEWPTAAVILGSLVTVLGFLWGIIKTFKKEPETNKEHWVEPFNDLKKDISKKFEQLSKEFGEIKLSIEKLKFSDGYDQEIINDLKKNLKDLEGKIEDKVGSLSKKQDQIITKFLEFLQNQ